MFITLVGGLGSIILGAVVLGTAFALLHLMSSHKMVTLWVIGGAVIVVPIAVGAWFLPWIDGPCPGHPRRSRMVRWAGWLALLFYGLLLLALIGIAAGVK
jgi:hypothetical protein